MANEIEALKGHIEGISNNFNDAVELHGAVKFKKEAAFAVQALENNDFLKKIAYANPQSLRNAVMNIATIGISLNPALRQAYLVPRDGKVILDISYMGFIHLACESGAIKWVQAQLVYQKDFYQFNGVGQKPTHRFESFNDRGSVKGVYVVAKTEDGEFLTEQMSLDEVYSIRDRTKSWKAFLEKKKSTPWNSDEGEMIKKTAIKRAFKLWPKVDKRLSEAIAVSNETEGIELKSDEYTEHTTAVNSQVEEIRDLLKQLGKEEKEFIGYFSRVIKRNFSAIEELNNNEAEQALIQLKGFVRKVG